MTNEAFRQYVIKCLREDIKAGVERLRQEGYGKTPEEEAEEFAKLNAPYATPDFCRRFAEARKMHIADARSYQKSLLHLQRVRLERLEAMDEK
jgi:hypothetical protein